MFISGQEASLSASTLHRHLMEWGLSPSITRKIKTKKSHYSSFQVEIPDTDVDLIFNEDIWNPGAIIHAFQGAGPKDDEILETYPRGLKL